MRILQCISDHGRSSRPRSTLLQQQMQVRRLPPAMANLVPADLLEREVEAVYRANCPKCNLPRPVDLHKFHEVLSFVVLTRWTTKQQLSCFSCARKRQVGAIALSLVAGWWGFPFGLILTPVQVTRNIIEMCSQRPTSQPSANLRRVIRVIQVNIGRRMSRNQQVRSVPPPSPV